MKPLIQTLSKLFSVAIVIALLNSGSANGDYFQGCQTCGVLGCRNVSAQSFGGEGCESHWVMNGILPGIECTVGGSVCYRASTSIDVPGRYPDNDFNCNIWDWMMGWC